MNLYNLIYNCTIKLYNIICFVLVVDFVSFQIVSFMEIL